MRLLLLLHALLLLLASTDFTIVTAALGQDSWRWSYFKYSSQSGWRDTRTFRTTLFRWF